MSYVRWSTPIKLPEGVDAFDYFADSSKYWDVPTSDFYIYDHVDGFVSVNVAGNRHRPSGPFERVAGDLTPWLEWVETGREKIDHPDAGKTFEFGDMTDAIAKVETLIADGLLAPDWLLEEMRAGIEEAAHTPEER